MSFPHYIEMSLWVVEDALFQVLQWQNMHVSAFPLKMTMVLRFAVQYIVSEESANIFLCYTRFITSVVAFYKPE